MVRRTRQTIVGTIAVGVLLSSVAAGLAADCACGAQATGITRRLHLYDQWLQTQGASRRDGTDVADILMQPVIYLTDNGHFTADTAR